MSNFYLRTGCGTWFNFPMNPADIQNITIETPRLILRQPTMDDVDAIHAAKVTAWHDLQQWMSWTADGQETRGATEDFVRKSQSRWDDGSLMFAAFRRDNGAFAISTGLTHKDDGGIFETGYWAAPDQKGHGFATEATNAVIRAAFNILAANAVTIGHFAGNEPSKRIIHKLGFTYTHTKEKGAMQFSSGQMIDEVCYRMDSVDKLPALDYRALEIK
jgi:RimJ/RimL family protein N-acetyltransferase